MVRLYVITSSCLIQAVLSLAFNNLDRRQSLAAFFSKATAISLPLHVAISASAAVPSPTSQANVWISGRPQLSISASRDPTDKSGTKRDSKFLKCLSGRVLCLKYPFLPLNSIETGCVAEFEKPDEKLKDRTEIIADCQSYCCFSYEQCTSTLSSGIK